MTKVNRLTPDRLRHELARFEAARGISSAEFYRLLLDGEIGGSPENDAWAVLCGQAVLAGMLSVPPMPPRPEGSLSEVTVLTTELLRERLAKFEAERGMSSAEFYERFNAGLEGDSMDAMEWASLCDFAVDMGIFAKSERVRASGAVGWWPAATYRGSHSRDGQRSANGSTARC